MSVYSVGMFNWLTELSPHAYTLPAFDNATENLLPALMNLMSTADTGTDVCFLELLPQATTVPVLNSANE